MDSDAPHSSLATPVAWDPGLRQRFGQPQHVPGPGGVFEPRQSRLERQLTRPHGAAQPDAVLYPDTGDRLPASGTSNQAIFQKSR